MGKTISRMRIARSSRRKGSPPHSRNIRGGCLQIIQKRAAKKNDREDWGGKAEGGVIRIRIPLTAMLLYG
jgi:hypothetical protein